MAKEKQIKTKQLGVPVEPDLHSRILRCAAFCAISAGSFAWQMQCLDQETLALWQAWLSLKATATRMQSILNTATAVAHSEPTKYDHAFMEKSPPMLLARPCKRRQF